MIIRNKLILLLIPALLSCGKKDFSGDEIFVERNELIAEQKELAKFANLDLVNNCLGYVKDASDDLSLLNCENKIDSLEKIKHKKYSLGGDYQSNLMKNSNRPISFNELLLISNNEKIVIFDTEREEVVGKVNIKHFLSKKDLFKLSRFSINKTDEETVVVSGDNGLVAKYDVSEIIKQYHQWKKQNKYFGNPINGIKIKPIWSNKVNGSINAPVTVVSGNIFAISNDDTIFLLDEKNGEIADYNQRSRNLQISTNTVVGLLKYQNQIIASFGNGEVVSYSAKENKLQTNWSYDVVHDGNSQLKNIKSSDIDFQPTIINNLLFVGGISGGFMAINLNTGIPIGVREFSVASNIANNGKFLFFIDSFYNLIAVNSQTLAVIWHVQLDDFINKNFITKMFAVNKKKIYTGPFFINDKIGLIVDNGEMLFLDLTSGLIVKKKSITKEINSLPLNIDQKLYLIDKNNILHLYY